VDPVVEMVGITKRFPGVVANRSVDFLVQRGHVHGLLGENGAGKTTLMNILYGLYHPDEGEIKINGTAVTINNPGDAIELGLGMVHQHFQFVPRFTVAENFLLGMRSPREPLLEDRRKVYARIRQFSEQYNLPVDPSRPMWQLSVGEQQRVELLRALYRGAEILILDEPTSVLTPQEVIQLASILENLVSMGKAIIFITHKLEEVMKMTHRVTVMRDGAVVGTLETGQTSREELVHMMVGRPIGACPPKIDLSAAEKPALRVESLRVLDDRNLVALKDLSLEVGAGEILGVAGVDGNGQTELEEAIVGLRPIASGQVFLGDQGVTRIPVRGRRGLGLAYIPSDRYLRGVVRTFSVSENLVLGQHTRTPFAQRGVFNNQSIANHARERVKEFDIRTPDTATLGGKLSGGNAQRLILARELGADPKLIVACQPTRGLDVGATEYVRNALLEQRNQGVGVLLISADLEEIMTLSDRIAVLYEGEIVGILDCEEAEVSTIGMMMAGGVREDNTPR
jgi:simple sugar transport system ATP-binding protein